MSTEGQEVGIGYLKTFPGILKIAQEVANFIGMICIAATGYSPRGDAFLACSIMAIILTGVLLVCYMTKLVVKFQIPWFRIEFFYAVIWVIFYIIVSSLVVSVNSSGYIAGGVFGFIATLLYIADGYHKFRIAASA